MLRFIKSLFKKNDSDEGVCTKCRFNIDDQCIVGTYYAEKGVKALCFSGELWECIDKNEILTKLDKLDQEDE